jgi:amidase
LRIAVALEPPHPVPVDPACAAAARDAAALLEELGHEVEAVTPPQTAETLELFAVVWQTIPTLYPVEDASLMEPTNAAFAERARATSSVDYLKAFARLQLHGRALAAFCAQYDAVLTPTLALPPVPVGWVREPADPWEQYARAAEFTPFTPSVNVAGLPAVSVPFAWTEDGLPLGVHLIGPAGGEGLLLRLSGQLEAARPWIDRRPPVS